MAMNSRARQIALLAVRLCGEPPVLHTGARRTGTEYTQLFSTTSVIFECSRLLIDDYWCE